MFACFVHGHKKLIMYNACRAKPEPYYDTIIIWLFVNTFSSKIIGR